MGSRLGSSVRILCANFLLAAAWLAVLQPVAHATPYWSQAEIEQWEASGDRQSVAPGIPVITDPLNRPDYLEMFGRIAGFIASLQVATPGDPSFGGIREGEHMLTIIQTDNTSEAIWVWSRYYELTGDNQYHQNILDAYTYCMNFPAYMEEGGEEPATGYYRMYNCGWAVRAEQKYRDVYGDDAYLAYATTCGDYLSTHTLVQSGAYASVNVAVLSWAMGNLYYAGVRHDNAAWRDEAVRQAGEYVKAWVEANPTLLAREAWAMAGGATMWGLLNSYFVVHFDETAGWLNAYKSYMDIWSSPGQFQNAWNGWYALGHDAVAEALDDATHAGYHLAITDFLIAEDADLDGGIPARPEETDAQDQTWVANYLAYMGCDPVLPGAAAVAAGDTGPLAFFCAAPNPAAGPIHLHYSLSSATDVVLQIVDASGRSVARLNAGQAAAGDHRLRWTGADDSGRRVAAGAYYAVLRTGDRDYTRPILWLPR